MMLGEKQGGQNKWESLYAAQRVQVASEELWKNNEFLKKCMKKGERREKYQAWNMLGCVDVAELLRWQRDS